MFIFKLNFLLLLFLLLLLLPLELFQVLRVVFIRKENTSSNLSVTLVLHCYIL
jgi:hypothetical protein